MPVVTDRTWLWWYVRAGAGKRRWHAYTYATALNGLSKFSTAACLRPGERDARLWRFEKPEREACQLCSQLVAQVTTQAEAAP